MDRLNILLSFFLLNQVCASIPWDIHRRRPTTGKNYPFNTRTTTNCYLHSSFGQCCIISCTQCDNCCCCSITGVSCGRCASYCSEYNSIELGLHFYFLPHCTCLLSCDFVQFFSSIALCAPLFIMVRYISVSIIIIIIIIITIFITVTCIWKNL